MTIVCLRIHYARKGFWIPSKSYANYQTSLLSITSTLHMNHLLFLTNKRKPESKDRTELSRIFNSADGIQTFKNLGYNYYHLHSSTRFTKFNKLATKHLITTKNKFIQYEELYYILLRRLLYTTFFQVISRSLGAPFH